MNQNAPYEGRLQALVVLQAHNPQPVLNQLKREYQVISVMPPLLLVISIPAQQLRQLHIMDGIEFIFLNENIPVEFIESLSEAEKLFVNGWQVHTQTAKPKTRPGDNKS